MDEGQLEITHRVHNVINMLSLLSRISSVFIFLEQSLKYSESLSIWRTIAVMLVNNIMWYCIDEPPPPGLQGAMQLTFRKLGFDYYPVHRPGECDDCPFSDCNFTAAYPEALSCPHCNHSIHSALAIRITIQAD